MTRFGGVARGALVAIVVATAAACSDSDGGGGADREAYVDALAATADDAALDADARDCYAKALVDTIGVDALRDKVQPDEIDASFSPAELGIELDEDQGNQFYDRLSDCVDVRDLIVQSMSAGQELPAETVACIDQHIDDQLAKSIIVASVTKGDAAADDPEISAALNGISTDCAPTATATGATAQAGA
jgi:hypothetical protein